MKKVMLLFLAFVLFFAGYRSIPASAKAAEDLAQSCKAAYLCDWRSGTPVFSKDAEQHLPIASMCKIMTLLLCFEEQDAGRLQFEEQICVSDHAAGMGGSQVFLEAGGNYQAGELVKSICIASANDSCVAMAERICGSEELFVRKMNARAKELGMSETVFANCTGLPESGQYSCARDVAFMLSALLEHEKYFDYSQIWMDEISHNGGRVTEMANTNKMIRSYQGCDGGKTGYTAEAGFCLAASAVRGNMRAISVVIGAPDSKTRFDSTRMLLDYIFANYRSKAVLEDSILPQAYAVTGGKQKTIFVKPARSSYVFCSNDDTDEIFYEIEMNPLRAPIRRGETVGRVVVYKNNIEADTVALLANEDVVKSSYFDSLKDLAQNWNY